MIDKLKEIEKEYFCEDESGAGDTNRTLDIYGEEVDDHSDGAVTGPRGPVVNRSKN